jgi:hypothetical protein
MEQSPGQMKIGATFGAGTATVTAEQKWWDQTNLAAGAPSVDVDMVYFISLVNLSIEPSVELEQ